MMRRPRMSEPSNLHRWQHFGKPNFMRICRAKLGLYGTWINANCSVLLGGVAEVSAKRQQSNTRRGVQRAGSMCAHTWVSWTKCIAAPPGWWFTGWKKVQNRRRRQRAVQAQENMISVKEQLVTPRLDSGWHKPVVAFCYVTVALWEFLRQKKKKTVNSHHYCVECHWNSWKPLMCI